MHGAGRRVCRSAVWNDDEVVIHWRGDFDAQEGGRAEGVTRIASCSARLREVVEMAPEDDARFWTDKHIGGFLEFVAWLSAPMTNGCHENPWRDLP